MIVKQTLYCNVATLTDRYLGDGGPGVTVRKTIDLEERKRQEAVKSMVLWSDWG